MSPRILVLPGPVLYQRLFDEATDRKLRSLGQVEFNPGPRDLSSDELAARIEGVDALITGWKSPRLTDAVLKAADKLKLVSHSAGSVRFMLDESLYARGIRVSAATAAMAPAVAEATVLMAMLILRPIHRLDAGLRDGMTWEAGKAAGVGDELAAQTVGVVGAGHVGRTVIRLLRAWDVPVVVYDPTLSVSAARQMGVKLEPHLDALMSQCSLVTLHAPALPQTRHMIGKAQLAAMKPGGALVNTARSAIVDSEALIEALQSGHVRAAVDVYDEEPMPPGSPWRKMPNSIITPHIAASTRQCFHRQGRIAVDEVERFLTGRPLEHEVKAEAYAMTA